MKYEDLENAFLEFRKKNKNRSLSLLSQFFSEMRTTYERSKIAERKKEGYSTAEAQKKTRQGWVSFSGRALEKIIKLSLEDFCAKNEIKVIQDNNFRNPKTRELLSFH